jgi:hypothetical protein
VEVDYLGTFSADNIIDHAIDMAPVAIGGYIAYLIVKSVLDKQSAKEEEKRKTNTGKTLGEQIWWNFTHQNLRPSWPL